MNFTENSTKTHKKYINTIWLQKEFSANTIKSQYKILVDF